MSWSLVKVNGDLRERPSRSALQTILRASLAFGDGRLLPAGRAPAESERATRDAVVAFYNKGLGHCSNLLITRDIERTPERAEKLMHSLRIGFQEFLAE